MSKELEHVDARLKDIASKVQSLRDQLSNLVAQESALKLRKVELVHGVKVGSVVRSKGIDHRVTKVDTRFGLERPWLEGNPRKKDETFGTAVRNLFDNWEYIEEQSS